MAETTIGLEDVARDEIVAYTRAIAFIVGPGEVRFSPTGDPRRALQLRSVQAVYSCATFAVPRPKALLGDAHFRRLGAQIDAALREWPAGTFRTIHIAAAGAESAVMRRLLSTLATRTGLEPDETEGDLLVRLRPDRAGGWETLVRLTPRPLATRTWRVQNFPGALNAAVASAMTRLLQPTARDVFVNLCCGSGSLLIERAAHGPAARLIGLDIAPAALALCRANLNAAGSGLAARVELIQADAGAAPLPDGSITTICADLPFGQQVGSHAANLALYPAALADAARIAAPGARMCIISHETRLMSDSLARSPAWELVEERRISLNGIFPRIYLLRRLAVL
ncbi:MAG: methyltransferase domain-containing protein [Thermoflexales bacterium]